MLGGTIADRRALDSRAYAPHAPPFERQFPLAHLMALLHGNTTGLSPSSRKLLQRIYRRRVPLELIATPELVRSLVEASRETKRQVGVLIHRSGSVESVIVGHATGLMLPDIGRLRAAQGRFRALRLVHTHLFGEPLTKDDLVDLTRLRLDLVAAVQLTPEGEARALTWAYNVPPREADGRTQPYEVVGPILWGRPQPNFGELIESLEEEFAHLSLGREVAKDGRAILVHVGSKRGGRSLARARASMEELVSLAQTAGVEVIDTIIQLRDRIDPKFVFGKGKLEDVLLHAIDVDAQTLIFDRDLTPTQASSIAARTDLAVLDRTQLILDIFAQRAETRDGKLQVELAQLKYRLPRLGQKDDALSRLTGGIGGRGPGETKLEIGRRRARDRINRLEKELQVLERQRAERRRRRAAGDAALVAIVGYTNAGKSTLLNTVTGANVLAEDKLFATLDTRARRLRLPGGRQAIFSDTVGFIRDMPRDLFAAFKATFEEARDADLLLTVVDASDQAHPERLATTLALLGKLQLDHLPRLTVYNKVDLLEPTLIAELEREDAICISAQQKNTTRRLLEAVEIAVAAKSTERSDPRAAIIEPG